jgi:asparagine synthase (glutamine-hydrolysing)
MPGLVGILGKGPPQQRREELGRMRAALYRKEPTRSGSFINEDLGVYAAWTCHPGSYADGQPATSSNGDIAVLFGGEHYAPADGGNMRPSQGRGSPPEGVAGLPPLYEELGEGALELLNGFFHGLIVDSRDRKAILFNDRFGMQRLYYHEEPGAVLFASEAKALLAIRPALRAFDPVGLGEWMSCGCVLENRSLYQGVRVLPGATAWTWRPDGSEVRRTYFTAGAWEDQPALSTKEFYGALRATFRRVLPDYVNGPDTIGMSATGGLDTRMILANLGTPPRRIHCYSFTGPYRECLDASIGRRLASASGHPHTTIRIGPDFFRRFPDLAGEVVLATDGNLEMSGVPNLYVNEVAREISPVRLTGNYGSEVLRRHRAFRPTDAAAAVLSPEYAALARTTASTWQRAQEGHRLTYIAFKQIPWYSFNRLQAEQSLVTMRSPFMDNALLQVVYRAPAPAISSSEMSLRLIADGNPLLGRIKTDRGVTFPRRPTWPLDRAYYEFLFKMEYYAGHGMPRLLAVFDRHMGPLRIERLFLGKNKYYHLRQWFRDELAPYVRETLLDGQALRRDYVDPRAVTRAVQRHLAGAENHTYTISQLLTLEIAHSKILTSFR